MQRLTNTLSESEIGMNGAKRALTDRGIIEEEARMRAGDGGTCRMIVNG